MKKLLTIGTLTILSIGVAGWYLFKGQPAATPGAQSITTQQKQPLDPTKHDFFDVDFSQKMIVHHQQGVMLADTALGSSTNQSVRSMAEEMKKQQADAESQYKAWLEEWGEKYTNLADFPQMDGHDMYPSYPGLVSAASMTKLKSAVGTDRDRLFIELMKEHHNGGIQTSEMSNKLQYGKLIDFKDKVSADYKVELQEMEKV